MDRNSIIGIVLIIAILVGYSVLSALNDELKFEINGADDDHAQKTASKSWIFYPTSFQVVALFLKAQ